MAGDDNPAIGTLTASNSGTALTWTARGFGGYQDGYSPCAISSATAISQTQAETVTKSIFTSGKFFGINTLRFSGSDGIGAAPAGTQSTSGAPQQSITTTQANSAIGFVISDWNASDLSSATWLLVNGQAPTLYTLFRDASAVTIIIGVYSDAGSIGAKTVGISSPSSGMKWAMATVEIKGTAGGAAGAPPTLMMKGM